MQEGKKKNAASAQHIGMSNTLGIDTGMDKSQKKQTGNLNMLNRIDENSPHIQNIDK